MKQANLELKELFNQFNDRVEAINTERRRNGELGPLRAEVKLLGQMSLLVDEKVSMILSLAQTADLDALLDMDSILKEEFKQLLNKHGLVYDEDSYLIWIPKGASFISLFDFKNVVVKSIDAESALVSKAVKAPQKNKQLIREAIASAKFPSLVERIEKSGGDLEFFARD